VQALKVRQKQHDRLAWGKELSVFLSACQQPAAGAGAEDCSKTGLGLTPVLAQQPADGKRN
jgi:hypothetical protein